MQNKIILLNILIMFCLFIKDLYTSNLALKEVSNKEASNKRINKCSGVIVSRIINTSINSSKNKTNTKAFEYFIYKGLGYISNMRIRNSLLTKQMSLEGSCFIGGEYKIVGDRIRLSIWISDSDLKSSLKSSLKDKVSLEGKSLGFTKLIEKLVNRLVEIIRIKYVNSLNFASNNFRRYISKSPKILKEANAYTNAFLSYLREDFKMALKSVKLLREDDLDRLYLEGIIYYEQGHLPKANYFLSKFFQKSKKAKLLKEVLRASLKLGSIMENRGNKEGALKLYQKVLKTSLEINDYTLNLASKLKLGRYYISQGEYDTGRAYYHEALRLSNWENDKVGEGIVLYSLSYLLYLEGEYKKSTKLLNQAILSQEKSSDPKEIIKWKLLLLDLLESRDRKMQLKIFEELLQKSKPYLKTHSIVIQKVFSSGLYKNKAKLNKLLNQTLKIQKYNKDLKEETNIYRLLGDLHKEWKEYIKSLSYYEKALQNSKEMEIKQEIAKSYTSIGAFYSELKKPKKSLYYFNEALKIRKGIKDRLGEALTKISIASLYIGSDKKEDAIKIYNESLLMLKSINYKEGEALTYWMLGLINTTEKDYKKALNYYTKAYELFIGLGSKNAQNIKVLIKDLKESMQDDELDEDIGEGSEVDGTEEDIEEDDSEDQEEDKEEDKEDSVKKEVR